LRSAITSACAKIGPQNMPEKIANPNTDRNLNTDSPSMDTPFFLMACPIYDLPLNALCFWVWLSNIIRHSA